jgi:hypothetical protein
MPDVTTRPRRSRPLSPPSAARRIFGLDFSGATDAGRRAWLAEGRSSVAGLEILTCRPIAELPGGAIERTSALAALRAFIATTPDGIFGCDFPFSLPRAHIETPTWKDFIGGFLHADALAFYTHCRRISGGCEPKRATDRESKTPWCAFNIRLYRQSYHGMAELLRPLVSGGEALVLPMQAPAPGVPWLIETCPASALKHLGWRGSYKGAAFKEARRQILRRLSAGNVLVPLPRSLRERVVGDIGGDALDSVIAALATARALGEIDAGDGGGDALEGRVYFRLR